MIYFLAAVGAVTVVVLMWQAFGPERRTPDRRLTGTAPDDDPDFLRRIEEQQRQRRNDEDS